MTQKYLKDQRGVAMLLELVLVAVVLGLVGLAVYQASNNASKGNTASVTSKAKEAAATESLAASAAATTEKESAADVSLSAGAETSADELSDLDNDITSLEGTSDASF